MSTPTGQHWTETDRRALAAVAAQFWINGMVYAALIPRLPEVRDRLGISVAGLGLSLTVAAVGGLVGSAAVGSVVARFGTRRCIIGGTAITLPVLPVIGVTNSVFVFTASLAVLGLLDVIIDVGMNIQGSRLSARRSKPVMNRLHGLWSLGTVLGGLVAVRAASAGIAIWIHLVGVAVVLAVTIAVSGRFLLSADSESDSGSESELSDSQANPETGFGCQVEPAGGLWNVWLRQSMILALLGGAAVTMELTSSDWAAFRLSDDLGASGGTIGLGFVAFTAGMVTGRFAGDAIQGLTGAEALVRYAAILAAFGLALATIFPESWAGGLGLTQTTISIAGFYVAALGVSVIFPQLYDRAAKAPGPAGRGLASLTGGTRIAGLIAPVIVGFLADTSLSVGAAIAMVTIPSCAVTLVGSRLSAVRPSESARRAR